MRALTWMTAGLQAQRGGLFPWIPVAFGTGIALFFEQKTEPSVATLWTCAGVALLSMLAAWRLSGSVPALFLMAAGIGATGFATAGWRAHDVAAPVLEWRYYGPIEGRVVGLDRSASDAVRVTLDQVRLGKISGPRTPERVRISLHADAAEGPVPRPGARIMTTGHLSPPGGPVEPGGFDFQRHAWFAKLGGVGYVRVPVLVAGPAEAHDWRLRIFAIRMAVSEYVRDRMPGDVGGFAAAVTAGDRSGMGQGALDDLRAANLAHLLAISGLHMGLLTGFVFAALRFGLIWIPGVALRLPVRSIAAGGALIAGAFYLALSGGNVATERAFIMAAVALCAVMMNRRAISIRSVAIAAMVVLILRPEALLGPGFQMSFAATTALVAVFAALREAPWRLPKWMQPVLATVVSSGVAGLATAPFAAAHFNAIAHYGLPANILSVPIMGTIVVPAAVLAVCLAPLGLSGLALTVMGWGLSWILLVAETTANLPGARSFVWGPGPWVLPCLTLGALVLMLWRGQGRWAGLAPMALAFFLWAGEDRATLLIADSGSLVGIMTPEGRAISRERTSGFIARNWLENDGDGGTQVGAHARWVSTWPADSKVMRAVLGQQNVLHATGKAAQSALAACSDQILVTTIRVPTPPRGCRVYDPDRLQLTGAVAFHKDEKGELKIVTARQIAGDRLWSQWPEPPQDRDQYVRINPTSRP